MLSAVILAAATFSTTVVPSHKAPMANLPCSTAYGCEVVVECDPLKDVSLTNARIVARTVGTGDDGLPARVQLLPTSAFMQDANSIMQPVSAKLSIVTMSGRELDVVVDAVDIPVVNRLVFGCANQEPSIVHVAMTRSGGEVDGVGGGDQPNGETTPLDPTKMDFGWTSTGSIRCVTAFSVGLQLWCKMPSTTVDIPSVYFDDGKLKIPANARVVGGSYLVIENGGAQRSILLEIGGGDPRSGHIVRSAQ
jgi:hypothetical protein